MSDDERVLAVCQQGGHLAELLELVPRMTDDDDRVEWVTFDTEHSRSLLDGRNVHYVEPVMPRDFRALARNVPVAHRILRGARYAAVIGSGALSLAFLPEAAAIGLDAHFIESATRVVGPSLTGRILASIPGVRTYAQDPGWASRRWRYRGSIWDGFEADPAPEPAPPRSVVVTLGLNPYPFRAALEQLARVLPRGARVLWQTGSTPTGALPIEARETVPAEELSQAMAEADLVVAHAGTGSVLQALEAGKVPLVLPRRAAQGEQVDEHQVQLAFELAARDLVTYSEVEALSPAVIQRATGRRARRRGHPPAFPLT